MKFVARQIQLLTLAALASWAHSIVAQTVPSVPNTSLPTAATPTDSANAKAQDWRALAKADIEAVYQSTLANHPGVHDPLNPKFGEALNAAKQTATKYANQFDSAAGYKFALGAFRAKLNDGHAGVYTKVPAELLGELRWPGFVTTWRTDGLFVAKSSTDKIAVGAKVLGCDGQAINQIIKNSVFTFRLAADQPGQWWAHASRVFIDEGNPFVRLPARCEFETGTRKDSLEINWQTAPPELNQWRQSASFGEHLPTGLTQPAAGMVWIAMPDFQPDDAGIKSLEAMYKTLSAKNSPHLSAQAVVIDLRGNQGGSSTWSRRLAAIFWGKAAVDSQLNYLYRKVKIVWRASEGNEAALNAFLPELKKQNDNDTFNEIKKLVGKIANARSLNQPLLDQADSKKTKDVKKPAKSLSFANKKTPPVFVIMDGDCASACLDAVDVFKLYSKTILVGSPTASDSSYMEVRADPLPSGFGATIIPMKIWVDRPRGNGQFYSPDLVVNDLQWSSDLFLKRIQDNLNVSK